MMLGFVFSGIKIDEYLAKQQLGDPAGSIGENP
jgi:hypothetical protein